MSENSKPSKEFILMAIDNDIEALTNGVKFLFNCREATIEADGEIYIADPQHGHWLNDDDIARVNHALRVGDI